MTVDYEWDVETTATAENEQFEEGEVMDHWFCDTFAEVKQLLTTTPDKGEKYVGVLVRTDGTDRAWAYLQEGKLPDHFTDAYGAESYKVPKRFK